MNFPAPRSSLPATVAVGAKAAMLRVQNVGAITRADWAGPVDRGISNRQLPQATSF